MRVSGDKDMFHYYAAVSTFVFAIVALAHLARLFKRWKVQIGSLSVPMSGSWIGLVVAALLAFWEVRAIGSIVGESRAPRAHG